MIRMDNSKIAKLMGGKEREKERKKKDSFEIKIGKEEELGEKKEQQR